MESSIIDFVLNELRIAVGYESEKVITATQYLSNEMMKTLCCPSKFHDQQIRRVNNVLDELVQIEALAHTAQIDIRKTLKKYREAVESHVESQSPSDWLEEQYEDNVGVCDVD